MPGQTAEVNTTNTATQLLGIVKDVSIQSDAVQCLSYLASPGALLMAELPRSNQLRGDVDKSKPTSLI